MSVIEAKFGLFEVQLELIPSHAMKLHQPDAWHHSRKAYAVDVSGAFDKLVVAMIDSKVLF